MTTAAAAVVPFTITDPGFLFTAPLATAEPTNTVVGSIFTDAWPTGWALVGSTIDGSELTYSTKLEAVEVAEFLDTIKWATVTRESKLAFSMANWALANWKVAMNGGTLTVVSGTGATQLNSFVPPVAGSEVRAMLGWEALDHTARIVAYQCINGGEIKTAFKKAPNIAAIACEFMLEVPTGTGIPIKMYTAGTNRA
jgi:hypothetical protein